MHEIKHMNYFYCLLAYIVSTALNVLVLDIMLGILSQPSNLHMNRVLRILLNYLNTALVNENVLLL